MFPQMQTAIIPPVAPSPTPLKRGRLSDVEKERIAHLFETMRNPSPAAVARKLNRIVSTIEWHMMRAGMRKKPLQQRSVLTYVGKNGVECHSFTPEQDEFIEARRAEGKSYLEIADLATTQFGFTRKWYSVRTRLSLLASAPDA